MATSPPTIAFVTTTVNAVTVSLVPPTDPLYSHMLVFVYDVLTGAIAHASGAVAGPTYSTPPLTANRAYAVVAVAVDTGGEYSLPSNQMVTAETDTHDTHLGDPKVVITEIVQESRTKVRVIYRLEDTKDQILGELIEADYSFNGTFSDAQRMKESSDARHEGRFYLEFREAPFIINPHHYFIWDISELPDNTYHTFTLRFRAKSGALYSARVTPTILIDTTDLVGDIPVPVVVADTELLFRLPVFQGQTPLPGATVTVTEIRDDTDTDLLGAPVVIPALAAPNTHIYEDTISLPVGTYPPGRYRVFFTVAGAGYSATGSRTFVVVDTDYDINFALGGANLCLVYGKLVDNMDRPLVNAAVRATYIIEGNRYDRVSLTPITVYTNEYGFFAMHLLQNTEVVLEIQDLRYGQRVKVPAQRAANFNEIQYNQPSTLVRGSFGHVLPPEYQV